MINQHCQNCKATFVIEDDDTAFYKKINVPAPTWCPECRLQRKLAWFKGLRLYKRKCDLCREEKISMYRPDAPYTIYCNECWWSDKWDPLEYGREYDFSRPFFEQFNEHMHTVPLMGLAISKETTELSPFTNHCDHAKDCYLIFYSDYCEDAYYGFYLSQNNKAVVDCSITFASEQCYDSMNLFRSNRVFGARGNVRNSLDCVFVKDAKNAQHCFGSANLRNSKYVFFNQQLSKEEYEEKMNEIDLGSYGVYQKMKQRAEETWRQSIPHPFHDDFSENSTGNYVFNSKNCKECYDCTDCENCKYMMLIKLKSVKDSYDYVDWGEGAERIYDCITVGNAVSDVKFSQDIHYSNHVEYSKSCMGSSNLLGCIALRNKDYCIFNKQYEKEEFLALRKNIIDHMNKNLYTDKVGRKYPYGEFFPMTISPHDYNDTFANMFFPIEKEKALEQGLTWENVSKSEYDTTTSWDELPDHINDAKGDIVQEIIKCKTCFRGYRVMPYELKFLKKLNLPLPRKCPFCRIEGKIKRWIWQITLVERKCDKCGALFRTNYREEDAPTVYCKSCYQSEVV